MHSSQRARRESSGSTRKAGVAATSPGLWQRGIARGDGGEEPQVTPSHATVDPLLEFPAELAAVPVTESVAESIAVPVAAVVALPAAESVTVGAAQSVTVPLAALGGPPGAATGTLRARWTWTPAHAIAIATVLALAIGVGVFRIPRASVPQLSAAASRDGRLTIETRPGNLEVLVDGERRGTSPLTLPLSPGSHTVTIRNGREERVVPLTMAAGAEFSQYIELQAAETALASGGALSVVTDPPGARVFVDGRPRGTSPVTVEHLEAAEHKVTVAGDTGAIERTVVVAPGATSSVVFSLRKIPGPVGGWLAVTAPFDVEVIEDGDVIGTTGASRIMLAAGRHEIVLANRSLAYRESRAIDVTAGGTTTIRVEAPVVPVSVNARPWAEVILDGTSMGQTPIANVAVSVGPHEVVFRHPQFTERRQTVLVTANGPNRIAADLTK
jgi:hypothetical protein